MMTKKTPLWTRTDVLNAAATVVLAAITGVAGKLWRKIRKPTPKGAK